MWHHPFLFGNLIYALLGTFLVLTPFGGYAQNSVWNSAGEAKKSIAKNSEKAHHKLKDMKDHAAKWGMDTNYQHAFLIGGKLNSDGWSGCMNYTSRRSYTLNTFWQVSFSEIKHDKQTKQQGTSNYPQFGNPSPFVYGKINNVYTLQIGWGQEKLLLPAVIDGNISVGFRCNYGFSLAMLKPYYLKLVYQDFVGATEIDHMETQKYSQEDSAVFLKSGYILGGAGWSKGLNEISFVPGAYLELSFSIIPGKSKAFVQVISLGVNASYYEKPLAIMIDQSSNKFQANFFAGLLIGKRSK